MFEMVVPRRAYFLSASLLLPSRIEPVMRAAEVPFRRIQPADLLEIRAAGGILLLDLDIGVEEARAIIRQLRDDPAPVWRVCVIGSHVDREGLQAMREAGADRIVSRSHFVTHMQVIINELVMGCA